MENKTGSSGMRRMGMERWKYLDMANMSFAGGHYGETRGFIEAFLETIKEDSEEGKILQSRFNDIEIVRRQRVQDLEKESKNWGYLEQEDGNDLRRSIEIDAVYDQKTACWTVAMARGLFEE